MRAIVWKGGERERSRIISEQRFDIRLTFHIQKAGCIDGWFMVESSIRGTFIAAYVHSDPLRLRAYVRRPSLIRPSNIYGKVGWIVQSSDLINELRSASIFRPSQGIYALERACTLSMMMEETDPSSFLDGLDFLAGTFLPPIHPPRREKFDREELNIGEGNSQ